MDFFSYIGLVLRHAGKGWAEFIWEQFGWTTIFTAVSIGVGIYLQPTLESWWPSLKSVLGDRMSNVANFVVYGLAGVGVLALISFVFFVAAAPSQLHRQSQQSIAALQGTLSEREQFIESQLPRIRGEARNLITGNLTLEEPFPVGKYAFFCLHITLRNTGEGTSADGWKAWAVLADGRRVDGTLYIQKPSFDIDGNNGLLQIKPDDHILSVTESPISKGGIAKGYIVALFPELDGRELSIDGTIYFVKFTDTYDKTWIIEHDPRLQERSPNYEHFTRNKVKSTPPSK